MAAAAGADEKAVAVAVVSSPVVNLVEQTAHWQAAFDEPSIATMNNATLLRRNPPAVVVAPMPESTNARVTRDLDAFCLLSPAGSILSPLGYPADAEQAVYGSMDAKGNM